MKENKHLYFELLKYLSNYGIGVETNIKSVCLKYANKFEQAEEVVDVFKKRWSNVTSMLASIQQIGYIKYSYEHGDLQQLYLENGNFSVSITKEGLDYYYAHLLRVATVTSFRNQFRYNLITWGIAILSIAFSVFLAVKNDDLSNRVATLEKEKQLQKYPQHIKVAYDKNPNTR
jgi:hypothetical protein